MVRQRVQSSRFSRVREVTDGNQKKNRAQNTALRNSSLDRKRGFGELHLEPQVGCDRRGSLQALSGDGLGYHGKRVW